MVKKGQGSILLKKDLEVSDFLQHVRSRKTATSRELVFGTSQIVLNTCMKQCLDK